MPDPAPGSAPYTPPGEVSEWLMVPLSKSGVVNSHRGFESRPLRGSRPGARRPGTGMAPAPQAPRTERLRWARRALDGSPLRLRDLVAVARHRARVEVGEAARQRMAPARALVERLDAETDPVYGVNTGFGALADRAIPAGERPPAPAGDPARAMPPGWARRSRPRWCGGCSCSGPAASPPGTPGSGRAPRGDLRSAQRRDHPVGPGARLGGGLRRPRTAGPRRRGPGRRGVGATTAGGVVGARPAPSPRPGSSRSPSAPRRGWR